jgi:hypothetical protein
MAEIKGEDFNSKSRLDEDDVEGHRRDPEAGPDGYGSKSRESYGSKSRGSDEFGHASRESDEDDVEGHSFSTMRSPSSKGE